MRPLDLPDTSDALGDLCELAISFVLQLSESPLGRVVLGVHAESGRRAQLAEPLRDRYLKPRDAAITEAIERARQQGALHPDLAAETIRDLLFGSLVYHWLSTGEPLDRATAEALIAAARRAISP
ncbi:TetR-like C-terminal domain-containing protein [Saccharopolyspora elongata]|uniref:TetR-like C-terminal domain-containing protein n=1 Tax=Saccharopolyspora elongata TaxID=2530387 RepID=UPI001404F0FA|nr:TetR-like C-terminal domain-containing protein [Saccharopolyspora elongata]